MRFLTLLTAAALVACGTTPTTPADAPTPPVAEPAELRINGFVVQELGLLTDQLEGGPMPLQSSGAGVNSQGVVVGFSSRDDREIAPFVWQRGTMSPLGGPWDNDARAIGITDRGLIYGAGTWGEGLRPIRWRLDGSWEYLEKIGNVLGGAGAKLLVTYLEGGEFLAAVWEGQRLTPVPSNAVAINEYGWLLLRESDSQYALWVQGRIVQRLPAGMQVQWFDGEPRAMNKWGNVIGILDGNLVLWESGRVTPIVEAGRFIRARGISDHGTVLFITEDGRLMLWCAGKTIELPPLPGGTAASFFSSISLDGQYVTGASSTPDGLRAVRWTVPAGWR